MKIALQLYSIKDISENNGLATTLKTAKEMGYDSVEFAGFFGLTTEQVLAELAKKLLDSDIVGEYICTHCHLVINLLTATIGLFNSICSIPLLPLLAAFVLIIFYYRNVSSAAPGPNHNTRHRVNPLR